MSDWTESDLKAVNKALASGALRVDYGDREIQYRSVRELKEIRDLIREDLGESSTKSRVSYAKFSKGV